jgi:hypothetical protein
MTTRERLGKLPDELEKNGCGTAEGMGQACEIDFGESDLNGK